MALPVITSRNQVQTTPEIQVVGRVVLQPNTWYTCPAGKKAVCKGRVQCTGTGAAATVQFNAAGEILYQWDTGAFGAGYLSEPRALGAASDEMALFENIQLAAGETITTTQNTGTNAEVNLWMQVKETPI